MLVRKFGVPFYNLSRINFKDEISFDMRNDANSHFHRFLLAAPSFDTFANKKDSFHCMINKNWEILDHGNFGELTISTKLFELK